MTALDMHESLERQLQEIKAAHASEMQAMKDQLMKAELEGVIHANQCAEATKERDHYMRIATSLVAQFSTVESVFAKAKEMAIASGFRVDEPDGGGSTAVAKLNQAYDEGQHQEQNDTALEPAEGATEQLPVPGQGSTPRAQKPIRQARAAA